MRLSKILQISIFLFGSFSLMAQTKSQIEEITKNYDKVKINAFAEELKLKAEADLKKAVEFANLNNLPIVYKDNNGAKHRLMRLSKTNKPVYYSTTNVKAATSTRVDFLRTGGGLGLDLEGQDMTAYIWDIDTARLTHDEYGDAGGGPSRVTIGDGTSTNGDHATHVIGTVLAYGASPNAKGMAPQAVGISYNVNNDTSEAMSAAGEGMLVSNHSYGVYTSTAEDWQVGAYVSDSRTWDLIMNLAPYYLAVKSAGNFGGDDSANALPLEGNPAFDKLTMAATSKNSMIVASGHDLNIDGDGNVVGSMNRSYFSSEGPTDDYRIKPDIMGNGHFLYSSFAGSDSSYSTEPGTSMSAPNVTGSLLLLQQLYSIENGGSFMLSSTLRGLALHTADDGGIVGPDSEFGWGYMNSKKAAELILGAGDTSEIAEIELNEGESYIIQVTSDGTNPLLASICWNDPAAPYNNGTANDTTPRLTNDLDIRLTKGGTTFEPWLLTSVNTNGKGDNIVDNVERVEIIDAADTYELTVSHKGTLSSGSQTFSLILSGITETSIGVAKNSFSEYTVWPNPSAGVFNLTSKSTEIIIVNIFDILGNKVYNETYQSNNKTKQFNLSNLKTGVYTLVLEKENMKSIHKIIIK